MREVHPDLAMESEDNLVARARAMQSKRTKGGESGEQDGNESITQLASATPTHHTSSGQFFGPTSDLSLGASSRPHDSPPCQHFLFSMPNPDDCGYSESETLCFLGSRAKTLL